MQAIGDHGTLSLDPERKNDNISESKCMQQDLNKISTYNTLLVG